MEGGSDEEAEEVKEDEVEAGAAAQCENREEKSVRASVSQQFTNHVLLLYCI